MSNKNSQMHTWLGWRLTIVLGSGSAGTTGSVTLQTDARTWTKGTGLPIRIGSEESNGPATGGVADAAGGGVGSSGAEPGGSPVGPR